MYLLYLDESGTHSGARHFALAGVAVHETNVYWVTNQLERIQRQYFPELDDSALFHATSLRAKEGARVKPPFDQIDRKARMEILNLLNDVTLGLHGTFFAVVIEKSYLGRGEDPYERALEQALSRFNHFLRRMSREEGRQDKGLIVIADSGFRERLEAAARQLASQGTQWDDDLRNIVDIPFFTLSKNSRLFQIADLVANSVFGRYESGHAAMFDKMLPKFDQDENGRMHGLLHLAHNRAACYLPCCLTRRLAQPENL